MFGLSQGNKTSLTNPVLVYKVDVKNGKEELVRGLQFDDLSLRILKDIGMAGNDYHVQHKVAYPGSAFMSTILNFAFQSGQISGMGTPVSIIAPSILFEELELVKLSEEKSKRPILTHPAF